MAEHPTKGSQVTPSAHDVEGNMVRRPVLFPKAGDYLPGHQHNYIHTTIVHRGAIRFRNVTTGFDKVVKAGGWIATLPEQFHDQVAIEDNTESWCVFALRDLDGQIAYDVTDEVKQNYQAFT